VALIADSLAAGLKVGAHGTHVVLLAIAQHISGKLLEGLLQALDGRILLREGREQ